VWFAHHQVLHSLQIAQFITAAVLSDVLPKSSVTDAEVIREGLSGIVRILMPDVSTSGHGRGVPIRPGAG